MRMPTRRVLWFVFWVGWLLTFAVGEYFALVNPEQGDTLSEQVWDLTDQHPSAKFALAGILVWLTLHLFKLDYVLKNWIDKRSEPDE